MKIIIIGNSAAGLAAVKAIRKYDQETEITLVSKEGGMAYSRVLLPYVLRGKLPFEGLYIRDEAFYKENKVTYVEDTVVQLQETTKSLVLESGKTLLYDKLLIATGSFAVAPPIEGLKSPGVFHMWTKSDAEQLTPYFAKKDLQAVVLGSGFVALQGAWAAKTKGHKVTVVEIAERVMPNVLDPKGGALICEKVRESGVELCTSTVTEKVEPLPDGRLKVHLKGREPIIADYMIVGTGVRPHTAFLENTSVKVDRGIWVNHRMETSAIDVYAAGDVAAGPTVFGDEHLIHALWPTAVEMGNVAGLNMIGKELIYSGSLNMNVTQMYNVTVASMGLFNEEHIDNAYEFPLEDGYLKVCFKSGYVVGACLVGSSEHVALFGKLRTIIRKKIKTDGPPEQLAYLSELIAYKNKRSECAL